MRAVLMILMGMLIGVSAAQAQGVQGQLALTAAWDLGGEQLHPRLGLRWQQQLQTDDRPRSWAWDLQPGDWRSLRFQGRPLFAPGMRRAEDQEDGQSWGMNAAVVIIAIGAAVGLLVMAAGDAASQQQPQTNQGGAGDCDVPGAPPVTGACVGQFGN